MMLEIGGEDVHFAPRPIAGVDGSHLHKPSQLILDGQQRLTSLFQSLFSGKPVDTMDARGKKLKRWYYIDINQALEPDGDREEAIAGVPENRVLKDWRGAILADYSTKDKECRAEQFPLSLAFTMPAVFDWAQTYQQGVSGQDPDRIARWNTFYEQVLRNFVHYTVPVIILKKETPKEAVCTVFEKVNTGGIVLNVFELLTATFASEDFRLNDDWKERKERLNQYSALRSIEDTDFLQSVALLATRARREEHSHTGGDSGQAPGIGCKRRDILRLSLHQYKQWADRVEEAFVWAATFLAHERIFLARDLPYRTQLVPLAAIRVALGHDAEKIGVSEKLARWYWCGVLGELYGGTTETRFARDLAEVVEWIRGADEPSTIKEATFNADRFLTLRTRNSAAYKGIYALLMRGGCRDWLENKDVDLASFFNYSIDIHHVFPKKWCLDHKVDAHMRESIVNKTPLSARTNRIIGARAPSRYLASLTKQAEITSRTLDSILETHSIDATTLHADDFEGFFEARRGALITVISRAMGKDVIQVAVEGPETPDAFVEEPEELEESPMEELEQAS